MKTILPQLRTWQRGLLISALSLMSLPAAADPVRDAVGAQAPRDIRGTWALMQIHGVDHLEFEEARIRQALSVPEVLGFSMRVRWNDVDARSSLNEAPDFSLLERGYEIARSEGKEFSVRFMAGRHTPARILNDPDCPTYTFYQNGTPHLVPTPWKADGSPNEVFEEHYLDFIQHLAEWCRTRPHPVRLLHLSWFGQDWAELNHGFEVRGTPGYSRNAWMNAHLRLIDIGMTVADDDLSVELPLSGYGWLANNVGEFADYIVSRLGSWSPWFFVQANGWGSLSAQAVEGEWGAPDVSTEATFDANVWTKDVMRGLQMIQPYDYADWEGIFDKLYVNHATYAEVYVPSFSLEHAPELAEQIAKFDRYWNTPPELTIPPDLVIEATGTEGAAVEFTVDAWDDVDGQVPASASPESGSVFPMGITQVTVSATDSFGNTSEGAFIITVVDTEAPIVEQISASPDRLWPANHAMIPVTLTVDSVDAGSTNPVSRIVDVTSSEPVNGSGDGNTSPDWEITGDLTLNLRAERSGRGSGRTYTIRVETIDDVGNVAYSIVTVRVPHNAGG